MADARSMLRNARASRRIDHPQVAYSTTGNVVCLVCHIQLKSESLWEPHLRSSQHAMRLQRIRDGALGRPPGAPPPNDAKKRKAEQDEGNSYDVVERKKAKSEKASENLSIDVGQPEDVTASGEVEAQDPAAQNLNSAGGIPPDPLESKNVSEQSQTDKNLGIDEDEWAAFERDVATPPSSNKTQALDAINASATISAPAMSAAEVAAQSTEEANLQRKDQREAELEGEKEDAARQLEDEFDTMESYEARVKRLKERREQIRSKASIAPEEKRLSVDDSLKIEPVSEPGSSDDEDGSADDYDDWAFKSTR